MRTTKRIITFLLLISTLLLLISYFLPFVESSTKDGLIKDFDKDAYAMYELTQYDFSIFFFIIPILGLVFLLIDSKYAETLSVGFYISSFMSNMFYLASINNSLLKLSAKHSYSAGMIIMLVASGIMLLCALIMIILNILTKATSKAIIEINSDVLRQSLENLNKLKEQNFITASEYEEKRADLVRQLRL